jgi:hypothetical protein
MTTRQFRRRRPPASRAAALAQEWAWELATAGLIQLTRSEIELHLRGQVDRLLTALHADPFRPQDAQSVGEYLVGLGADRSDALRRTFLLLSRRLLDSSRLSGEAGRSRLDRLLAELIAGWSDARHAATLTEQDNLARAARAAKGDQRPGPDSPDEPEPPGPWFER